MDATNGTSRYTRDDDFPSGGPWPDRTFLSLLDDRGYRLLSTRAEPCRFRRGDTLIAQDDESDWVLLLLTGFVLIRRVEGGKPTALAVRGPGDLVGEFAGLMKRARTATVRACDRGTAWRLEHADFVHTLTAIRPRDAGARALAYKQGYADRRLLDTRVHPGPARVARVLDDLTSRYGTATTGGTVIPTRLSQAELAELVGISPATVYRTMRALRRDGVLAPSSRTRIVVTDPAELRRRARGSS